MSISISNVKNLRDVKDLLKDITKLNPLFANNKGVSYPESLLAKNQVLLRLVNSNQYKLELIVKGEVKILNHNLSEDHPDFMIVQDDRFNNKELMKAIHNGDIYMDPNCPFEISMNNWLEVYIYDNHDNIIDDFVYENEPSQPIDLLIHLIQILIEYK